LRLLMVCMQFPQGPGQSYMTTELAGALAAKGHQVEVLWLDWASEGPESIFHTPEGIRVLRCPARAVTGLGEMARAASKFWLSGRRAARMAATHLDLGAFDAMIGWMPAVAIAPLVTMACRAGIGHRLLFIWDFFPDHAREIGRIPGGLPFHLARWWEQHLLRRFTAVICTMPGNAAYLRAHYRCPAGQRVLVNPIWSPTEPLPSVDRAAVRAHHGLPGQAPIAVFGGQWVEGRGFEQMLAAAGHGAASASPLIYLFVGGGRLAPLLEERARRQGNVRLLGPMSREDYLTLLGACDVGMAATVPGVTSFSIPSKILDYLRRDLPIVAALEPGNDLTELFVQYGLGEVVPFGAAKAFHEAADRLARGAESQAARCLDEVFDVRHVVRTVEQACLAPIS
jgi:hypothetical protein